MSIKSKQFLFDDAAKKKLFEGIDLVAKVLTPTYGPKGRNIGILDFGFPSITSEGYKALKEITLSDSFANMGVDFCKELAKSIQEKTGDGTTLAILLLHSILKESLKLVATGFCPITLQNEFSKASNKILSKLQSFKQNLSDHTTVANIASVAAHHTENIGQMVAKAFDAIGKEAMISLLTTDNLDTKIEIHHGIQFQKGYASNSFANNDQTLEATLDNPKILITDEKIESIYQLLPLLENIAMRSEKILIVAKGYSSEVLSFLTQNKKQNKLQVAATTAPDLGDKKIEFFQDLSLVTHATFISKNVGLSLSDITEKDLGFCEKAILSKTKTFLMLKDQNLSHADHKIKQLQNLKKKISDVSTIKKIDERIAFLNGTIAQILIGGTSDFDIKQKKSLFEKAIVSTKSAIESGFVIGGAMSLFYTSIHLQNQEESLGEKILLNAIKTPASILLMNAGFESVEILNNLTELNDHTMGFDAFENNLCNFIEKGILDPFEVVANSFTKAVTTASLILLSETLIKEKRE